MAATGELALLPIIRPARVSVIDANLAPNPRTRLFQHPRVYRMPPGGKSLRNTYGSGGHAVVQNSKGRIIDLYT